MIHIQNFSLFYQNTTLLDNISLHIPPQSKFALIGASGSGKSLLCQSIMGILPSRLKQKGEISKDNVKFGVILQNPALCFDGIFTIENHFIETFKAHKIPYKREIIASYLQEVGLQNGVLDYYPFELSGGTLQRIMIALSISISPNFILADEPTSDLDCIGELEISNLLLHLQAKYRFTMLFVTHNFPLAAKLADKIFVMYQGKIIEEGESQTILKNPQHSFTQQLVSQHAKLLKTPWGDFQQGIKSLQQNVHQHLQTEEYARGKLVEVKHLSKSYKRGNFFSNKPSKIVLKDLNFSLHSGRSLGIIGKNGAGKSSLIRILLNIEKQLEGDIYFFNKKIKTLPHILRKEIQAVFQNPQESLNPRFTAKDCILEPLRNCNIPVNHTEEAIKLAKCVQLDPKRLNQKSNLFSGGEQQRIALARAISTKPKILILDEALSNLDHHLQFQMIELLKSLKQEFNMTYIVISHDLRVIFHLCEELILLNDGAILFQANKEEGIEHILKRDNPYFQEFFQASLQTCM